MNNDAHRFAVVNAAGEIQGNERYATDADAYMAMRRMAPTGRASFLARSAGHAQLFVCELDENGRVPS